MKHDGSGAPEEAAAVFGELLPQAARYAELLTSIGVERGLIGPRETERIWDRHVLNSAAVAELVSPGERVIDVGSGAGLPGIPLAMAAPAVRIVLVEPLLRRATFLSEVVADLGLANVEVVRGRAEDRDVIQTQGEADAVTSRAVASLDKLARWSLPLLRIGGRMLAMKGDRADTELAEYGRVLASLGAGDVRVMRCGESYLNPPATVVVAHRSEQKGRRPRASARRGR